MPQTYLLAQKGATAALDNIKEGVYLVSAVNGQVQLGLLAQSCQRDAAPCGSRGNNNVRFTLVLIKRVHSDAGRAILSVADRARVSQGGSTRGRGILSFHELTAHLLSAARH